MSTENHTPNPSNDLDYLAPDIDFTKIKVNPNAPYTETINTILPVKTLLDDIDSSILDEIQMMK